jgi:hypothetical protein
MHTTRRLAVCFIITAWPCLIPNTTQAQKAMPLPSACAAVIDSIARQHVAPDQFAGLRNTGTILCFSELAPPELQLSASLQSQPTARKPVAGIHTEVPILSNGTTSTKPKTLTPVSLSTEDAGPAYPAKTENNPAGVALNRAQEKVNQALNGLQAAGTDLDAWRACIETQFTADQIREPEVQASRFFKHWTQIVGLVFRSSHMNCTLDAPTIQEKAIHDLWPTRAERDEWKKRLEGFTPSDVSSEKTRMYWGLQLLDAIVEYHVALKGFKVEAERESASSVAPAAAARILPVAMRPPSLCKISSGPAVSGSGMPVTINLCKDTQGSPAIAGTQLVAVNVYDYSGKEVSTQPTSLKPYSFVLTLPPGTYDINSTVGPASGADSKPVLFLYESCANAAPQLCAFITAVGPGSSFSLKVN